MKVLILGGYGNFGMRIARALATTPGLVLFIGGRDAGRAQALAHALGGEARGVCIDWASPNFSRVLQSLGIEVLIHAAGPFQHQDYRVAQAAAQAGAHYIDLADARRFVADFPKSMDAAFQAAGCTAITGASTVPALSSAVVAHLTQGWQRMDTIDLCIAPAHTAPRGTATMAAVLDYCGAPIQVWCEGKWQQQYGWTQPQWVHFAHMRPRLGALCDIPDLELFPKQFGVTQRVMFRAALEVRIGQRVFAGLAALRKAGLVRQPRRLARPLNAVAHLLDPLGSELGGMVVRVQGLDATGQPAKRAWHMTADHNHGPEIPCMATIILARRLAAGESLPVGAHVCTGYVQLSEFKREFDRWQMVTDTIEEPPSELLAAA